MKITFALTLGFIAVICLMTGPKVQAARLFIEADKLSLLPGQSGFATINLDTQGKAANSASATLTFDPALVEVTKVTTEKSILTVWAQNPTLSAAKNAASFKGVILNPGYTGAKGRLMTVHYKAKKIGAPVFQVTNPLVLANDGKGTSLPTTAGALSLKFGQPPAAPAQVRISSPTHPDPKVWYKEKNARFSWSVPKDITQWAYAVTNNPATQLAPIATSNALATSRQNLPGGTQYFHLRPKHATNGWLSTQHFAFNIDAAPPVANNVTVFPRQNDSYLPVVSAKATDKESGVSYYEMLVNGKFITRLPSIDKFRLNKLAIGQNILEIRAYDRVGNARSEKVALRYNPLVSKK